jgi:hypothetical protein
LIGLQELERSSDIRIESAHTSFWTGLAAFTDTPPFDDPRVRNALKLASQTYGSGTHSDQQSAVAKKCRCKQGL